MNDVNCPYCGADQEISHDDGYGYEEDGLYEQECGECEKIFTYTTYIHLSYTTRKADCLNDGEHDWKAMIGAPAEYFEGRERCSQCNEERKVA